VIFSLACTFRGRHKCNSAADTSLVITRFEIQLPEKPQVPLIIHEILGLGCLQNYSLIPWVPLGSQYASSIANRPQPWNIMGFG